MRDFLFENGIRDVELLAYHRMGVGKGSFCWMKSARRV